MSEFRAWLLQIWLLSKTERLNYKVLSIIILMDQKISTSCNLHSYAELENLNEKKEKMTKLQDICNLTWLMKYFLWTTLGVFLDCRQPGMVPMLVHPCTQLYFPEERLQLMQFIPLKKLCPVTQLSTYKAYSQSTFDTPTLWVAYQQ